jgi:hypothetical protein
MGCILVKGTLLSQVLLPRMIQVSRSSLPMVVTHLALLKATKDLPLVITTSVLLVLLVIIAMDAITEKTEEGIATTVTPEVIMIGSCLIIIDTASDIIVLHFLLDFEDLCSSIRRILQASFLAVEEFLLL